MRKLPKGWEFLPISSLVINPKEDVVSGPFGSNLKASEYQKHGVPIIRLQNIGRNQFIEKNINYVSEQKADELEKHSFVAGDIVVTKLGEPLGKAAIIPETLSRGIVVADVVRIRVNPEFIDNRYVTYAINSPDVCKELEKHVKGTTRSRVNLSHIRELEIPVAPYKEQKKIADKLDKMLSEINTELVPLN